MAFGARADPRATGALRGGGVARARSAATRRDDRCPEPARQGASRARRGLAAGRKNGRGSGRGGRRIGRLRAQGQHRVGGKSARAARGARARRCSTESPWRALRVVWTESTAALAASLAGGRRRRISGDERRRGNRDQCDREEHRRETRAGELVRRRVHSCHLLPARTVGRRAKDAVTDDKRAANGGAEAGGRGGR